MKQWLRKIFFWDEPPQGAHFGLTLFFLVPWIGLTLMYFLIYPLFCISQCNVVLPLRLILLGILFVWLTAAYNAFLLIRLLIVNRHGLLKKLPWGMLIQGVVLFMAGFYLCRLLIIKLIIDFPLFSYNQQISQKYASTMNDRIIPALFSGNSVIIGIVLIVILLAAGYISLGKTIAGIGQVPYSQLWTKGVKAQWALIIGIYLLSWGIGLYAVYNSRKEVAKLEESLGKPLTAEALGEIYFHGQQPDADFWTKLQETEPSAILNQDNTDQTMDDDNSETESSEDTKRKIPWNTVYGAMAGNPFGESISQEIIDRWKTDFLNRPETKAWEALFEQPLPPAAREYSNAKPLIENMLPELKYGRTLCRYESSRIRVALELKDFREVEAALSRMRNASDYYEHDTFLIGGLVWVACEAIQMNALAHIIDSAQPSDEWLRQLDKWLESREQKVETVQRNGCYGEAITSLNILDTIWKGKSISDNGSLKPVNHRILICLMPQLLYMFAQETKGLAEMHWTGIEHGYRGQRSHGVFADTLKTGILSGEIKFKSITAEYRIVRGLIAAELHRRQHGSFPQELPLLQDPFKKQHQPLKYQYGEIDIYPQGEPQKKIHGVKIWTIGPNGKDEGGLFKNYEIGPDDTHLWLHAK